MQTSSNAHTRSYTRLSLKGKRMETKSTRAATQTPSIKCQAWRKRQNVYAGIGHTMFCHSTRPACAL
eukprot:6207198-Pleurochrysis_carterae.AAC.1